MMDCWVQTPSLRTTILGYVFLYQLWAASVLGIFDAASVWNDIEKHFLLSVCHLFLTSEGPLSHKLHTEEKTILPCAVLFSDTLFM